MIFPPRALLTTLSPRALLATLSPRALLATTLLLALAACSQASGPEEHASAAERATCHQRAEEAYNKQNRAEMYQTDSNMTDSRDTPFAASGVTRPDAGLSSLFQLDTMMSDCLRSVPGNVGAGAEPAPGAPAPAHPSTAAAP
jgi:hypothetical protein